MHDLDRSPKCPGITEVRPLAARLFGVRVQRHLVSKLRKVPGLLQPNPTSDLFCVEVTGTESSADAALRRFQELVAKAGLGAHFGVRSEK
ncbi:MAG: hypothetical protein HY554_11935 [Elusimicrobia bacterium]|nr:hypothetical protein [Elusimicrobiota bacterium]